MKEEELKHFRNSILLSSVVCLVLSQLYKSVCFCKCSVTAAANECSYFWLCLWWWVKLCQLTKSVTFQTLLIFFCMTEKFNSPWKLNTITIKPSPDTHLLLWSHSKHIYENNWHVNQAQGSDGPVFCNRGWSHSNGLFFQRHCGTNDDSWSHTFSSNCLLHVKTKKWIPVWALENNSSV